MMFSFFRSKYKGALESPDAEASVNDEKGIPVLVQLKFDGSYIKEAKFQTFGKTYSDESASFLMGYILTKKMDDILLWTDEAVFEVAPRLVEKKKGYPITALRSLKNAIRNYEKKKNDKAFQSFEFGSVLCTCFGVSATEIRTIIKECDCQTIEDVTENCKAGGGCGSCHEEIEEMLSGWQEMKKHIK